MNALLSTIESAVVMPSIGDDVLFQLNGLQLTSPRLSLLSKELPLHAKIVWVWSPAMVNLVVWDHYGNAHQMTSVKFLPPGEDVPLGQTYCELEAIDGELIEGDAPSLMGYQQRLLADSAHQAVQEKVRCTGISAERRDANLGRPLTYGEKAVGLSFNPGGLDAVTEAKAEAAMLIDRANDLRQASASPEVKRMASLAITAAQEAQMWLVKAQTWKD